MSLRNLSLKSEYRSLKDDIVEDFFNPTLQESIFYQRAVGFFSSSALVETTKGLIGLIRNQGKIQLIASPHLSEEDIQAMNSGYLNREIIRNALDRELTEPSTLFQEDQLNLLANLIAEGYLDIKITMTKDTDVLGMYHEKMGILTDAEGNQVAFSGSLNDSKTAISYNYEAIDVFTSWSEVADRVTLKQNAFQTLWNNDEPMMITLEFPEVKELFVQKYRKGTLNLNPEDTGFLEPVSELPKHSGAVVPPHILLHDYQIEAIDTWESRDYRGIFDMATGTGKTFTGLGAVARLSQHLMGRLAVFIVCPYQHLVEQWVEDIVAFGMKPIIAYGASKQKNWKKKLSDAILDQNLSIPKKEFFCVVATNATFSKDFIQSEIKGIRNEVLLVVDEAHNFGAYSIQRTLTDQFRYRLALSATINRHNDEEGTRVLFAYFGEKCIEYSLERAIQEGKLTPYKYYPIIISLNETELLQYKSLSTEIGKCIIKDKRGRTTVSERGKILLLARARLVASAEEKILKLQEKILPYRNSRHILVYCGAATMLAENQEFSDTVEEDIRQIDLVTSVLGNDLNMSVSQFTSKEDAVTRELLKERFAEGENLQALIAIKCLDEGVNIPKIKTAFILASTTNPKEYIQRRGRVLRLSPDKKFAEIYDFITLPRPLNDVGSLTEYELKSDYSLVKNELKRAEEFARLALNVASSESIIDEIKEAYQIVGSLLDEQEELDYE